MKTKMRIAQLKLYVLAVTIGFMLVLTSCEQENLTTTESENLVVNVDQSQARSGGPSANGQGTLTNPDGSTRHFSFHAREKNNGSIQGSGVLTYGGGLLKIKLDVDCLHVVGNTAHISRYYYFLE
jgi:hypothetical protein